MLRNKRNGAAKKAMDADTDLLFKISYEDAEGMLRASLCTGMLVSLLLRCLA